MKNTYYIPTGSWPLRVEPYHQLMAEAGLVPAGWDDAHILLLPGGADIGNRPERDMLEFSLYQEWSQQQKPVWGICRGMQIMLYAWDVPLLEHIPAHTSQLMHTTQSGCWKGDSSWHNTIKGLHTNSRHHQGFFESQVPLVWAVIDKTSDGIVEAVGMRNQFGVQWHPEHEEMIGSSAREWWIQTAKSTLL